MLPQVSQCTQHGIAYIQYVRIVLKHMPFMNTCTNVCTYIHCFVALSPQSLTSHSHHLNLQKPFLHTLEIPTLPSLAFHSSPHTPSLTLHPLHPIPHFSLPHLTPHTPSLTLHPSHPIPHTSPLTPHPSHHPSHPIPHTSPLTPHPSLLSTSPHPSHPIPHTSPLTPHPSHFTPHTPSLTPPLTPHPSHFTPHTPSFTSLYLTSSLTPSSPSHLDVTGDSVPDGLIVLRHHGEPLGVHLHQI